MQTRSRSTMIAHYIIIAEAMTRRIYHYLVTPVIYVTPYCGDSPRFSRYQPKNEAITQPFIQINFPRVDYMIFRLDHQLL